MRLQRKPTVRPTGRPSPSRLRTCLQTVAVLAAALLALLALPLTAFAQKSPTLAILMDGSGSMWGKLPGSSEAKFKAATELLVGELAKLSSKPNTGVYYFGQQSRGGCTSAGVLQEPAPLVPDDIEAALSNMNPKGRGPLVLGLESTIKAIGGSAAPGSSVIVIHDDPDNCAQDICASAAAIRQSHPGLRVFALTLNPKAADRGAMACLARETGGRTIEVTNAREAAVAIQSIVAAATGAMAAPAPAAAQPLARSGPASASRRATQPPLKTPGPRRAIPPTPGLMLSAVLAKDGPALGSGIIWKIYGLDGDTPRLVHRTTRSRPSIALPPGRYNVHLQVTGMTKQVEIEVKDGPRTVADIPLDSAALTLAAVLNEGAALVEDASFTVRRRDATGTAGLAWTGLAPRSPLVLAPGTYDVTASGGRAEKTVEFEAVHGKLANLTVALQAGYLHVETQVVSAQDGKPTIVSIETDDTTRSSGRRTVARSARPNPSFLLPAGTYYVKADNGRAQSQEFAAIAAGKLVKRRLVLPIMRLQISTRLKGSDEPLTSGIRYRIWPMRQPPTPPLTSALARPQFELSPGPYRIEARIGSQNAVVVRDFEVTDAPTGKIDLVFDAGTVALRVAGGGETGDIFWQVRDSNGRTVWRTMASSPRMTLKAGRYAIVADIGEQRAQGEIVVEGGRHIDIEIGRN